MVGQDLRPILGDGYGVFEVCGEFAVGSHNCPLVFQYSGMPVTQVQHGFDSYTHTRPQQRAHSCLPVIGHLGVLVEKPAHTVATNSRTTP